MWKSVEIWHVSNTLTFKQIFWKTKTFFKKLVYRLLVESTKTHQCYTKLSFQKPMLRQIELWVQKRSLKKNRVLPVITLFFWKFCFTLRTSYKSWFNVLTNQIFILILSVNAGALFEVGFSLWVSLEKQDILFRSFVSRVSCASLLLKGRI